MQVSTLRILSSILGILLLMESIGMLVNKAANAKTGYESQNLIVAIFYMMFSVALLGGAVLGGPPPVSSSSGYRNMFAGR